MGIGVAGQIARALGVTAALAAAGVPFAPVFTAHAQQAVAQHPAAPAALPQPAAQADLFNLSGSCSAPDTAVSTQAPLPNLAAVLQKRMNVRVLAIGNWISVGMGNQHRFTDELEEILERSVKGLDLVFTHRGVSGERTGTTAERIKNEIALVEPDLVLWQVGASEALMHIPVAEFEATLSAAVEWIREHGKDLVLVGLQYSNGLSKDPHYRAIKDAVGRVAARHNVLLVRRYEAVQFIATANREQAKLAKDEFAMTELGYKCMAEHIARALVVNAFGRRQADAGTAGQLAGFPVAAQRPSTGGTPAALPK